jgi:TetR/AcrR family transcriptional repressor of nem operon
MKVSRALAAEHRQALLEQAGRLFRARGIEGVSLAEVARAAGLTHGAFYGHFPSKSALAAEAVQASLEAGAAHWRRRAARARAAGADPLAAVIGAYLTERHRDAPEAGCALAALGPEVSRAGEKLSDALRDGTETLAEFLAGEVAALYPGLPSPECRARGLAILSAMTGGLVVSRALLADPDASRAALQGAARLARAAADTPQGPP